MIHNLISLKATCILFALQIFPLAALPGTITVTTSSDSGLGSLRQAVANASSGDTIRFSTFILGDTIKLTSGEITINTNLAIVGLGDDSTFISGNNSSRVFRIASGDTISIDRLTITQGMSTDSGGVVYNNGVLSMKYCVIVDNTAKFGGGLYNNSEISLFNCTLLDNFASTGQGGGIYSSAGNFSASNCTFENNTSVSGGGAIASLGGCLLNFCAVTGNFSNRGGGIYAEGALIVNNSDFTSNNANFGDGGGILNFANAKFTLCTIEDNRVNNATFSGGGIFSNSASFQLLNCTVANNISNGKSGGIHNENTFTINSSTIHGNSAGQSGGGMGNNGPLTMNSSTFSGNEAGTFAGGIENNGNATLSRTTIAFNTAITNGGGIYSTDTLEFSNTIIGSNSAVQGDDIFKSSGTVTSLGHNLVSDISQSGFNPASGDVLGTSANPIDPLLGALQDNGGNTLTHLLLCGSPAIDKGDSTDASSSDQRGAPRVHGENADIGSTENQDDPVEIDAVITNESSSGNADGSIQLLITGGTAPYFYEWNNGDSLFTISGLSAGNYSVTVEDFYTCTATAVFTVGVGNGIASMNVPSVVLFPNPATSFVLLQANFENPFSARILNTNGKVMKEISVSEKNGEIPLSLEGIPSGSYVLLLQEINSNKIIGRGRFSVIR